MVFHPLQSSTFVFISVLQPPSRQTVGRPPQASDESYPPKVPRKSKMAGKALVRFAAQVGLIGLME